MRVSLDQWRELPNGPGIYLFYGAADKLLYVGKSVHLRQRVRSYLRTGGGHSTQTERLKFEAQTIEVQPTGSELAALILENRLIKEQLPPFNRAQRRWKHYPFLRLDLQDAYPRLEVTRDLAEDGALYFGPYRKIQYLYPLVKQISVLLELRTCQDFAEIHHGCLLDQMHRCSAPCRGWISPTEYGLRLEPLRALLTGGGGEELLTQAKLKMSDAAQAERYEQAALWRDRHGALKKFIKQQSWRKQQVVLDVCAIYPTLQPEQAQVFWIQGGLLAASQVFTRADWPLHHPLKAAMARYDIATPTPTFHLPQKQLDEFHLIATWLYRNQRAPEVIWLQEEAAASKIASQIERVMVGLSQVTETSSSSS